MEEAVLVPESASDEEGSQQATKEEEGYVFVTGFVDNELNTCFIRSFFSGLDVLDVCFCLEEKTRLRNGQVVVKFRSAKEAAAALEYSYNDGTDILVERTDENKWTEAVCQAQFKKKIRRKRKKKPKMKARKELASVSGGISSSSSPHYVHLMNLPYYMTKEDVKMFIEKAEMDDKRITFFDRGKIFKKDAFVKLNSLKQMQECLKFHKNVFDDRTIHIFPSSKLKFQKKLKESRSEELQNHKATSSKNSSKGLSKLRCMYVRNFPSHVSKLDIQTFFTGFNVNLEDIFLLYDDNGAAMGEALVKFSTEHVAMFAESLHRRNFLGSEILLLRISEEQMNDFDGVRN
ncbi:RNA-binding protein 12B-like isoform X2 [Hyperolius riggenbachi]